MANSSATEYGDDCVLMLHMNGADASTTFTDSSDTAHTITAVGGAQIDTAQSKFGSASGLFDGAGDYLTAADHADWDFGTGDFTIDFWLRFNSAGAAYFVDREDSARFAVRYGGGNLRFDIGGGSVVSQAWSPSNGVWYHIAATRSGTNCYLFVDGTQHGSTGSSSFNISFTTGIGVGASSTGTQPVNGWMDEVRIVKGQAIWTANFTPPSAEYVADGAGGGGDLSVLGRRPIRSLYRGVMR